MPLNAANIVVTLKRPNLIIANTAGLVGSSTTPAVELHNQAPGISQSYVHNLLDVVETDPTEGDTLVYDGSLRKYVVRPPTLEAASIDGGGF